MKACLPSSKQKNEQRRQEQQLQDNEVILFVCVENARRSQMADGFFNHRYIPKGYRAVSVRT